MRLESKNLARPRVIANSVADAQQAAVAKVKPIPKKNLPASCDICGKEIARAGDLPRHKKTHLSDKSSILHYCPLCNFSSIQRSNVTVHIRIHTGEKPLKCPECHNAKFADPGSLTRHRKRFHGYIPQARANNQGGSPSSSASSSPETEQQMPAPPTSAHQYQQYIPITEHHHQQPHHQQHQQPQMVMQQHHHHQQQQQQQLQQQHNQTHRFVYEQVQDHAFMGHQGQDVMETDSESSSDEEEELMHRTVHNTRRRPVSMPMHMPVHHMPVNTHYSLQAAVSDARSTSRD